VNHHSHIPVVIYSNSAITKQHGEFMEAGTCVFICKAGSRQALAFTKGQAFQLFSSTLISSLFIISPA
jgi:hypothetical protein